MKTWGSYGAAQLAMMVATVVGWVVLILPCLLRAWELSPIPSINDGRKIDQWKWKWLRWAWDNPEDGVSGRMALVWAGSAREPYYPSKSVPWYDWAPWRAYMWSAWRNSANMLKYRYGYQLRTPGPVGPYRAGTFQVLGVHFVYAIGYKVENSDWVVPVAGIHKL